MIPAAPDTQLQLTSVPHSRLATISVNITPKVKPAAPSKTKRGSKVKPTSRTKAKAKAQPKAKAKAKARTTVTAKRAALPKAKPRGGSSRTARKSATRSTTTAAKVAQRRSPPRRCKTPTTEAQALAAPASPVGSFVSLSMSASQNRNQLDDNRSQKRNQTDASATTPTTKTTHIANGTICTAVAATIHHRPRKYDVIFGRGKPYQMHPGNLRMHAIILDHKPEYAAASDNATKNSLVWHVIDLVKFGFQHQADEDDNSDAVYGGLQVDDDQAEQAGAAGGGGGEARQLVVRFLRKVSVGDPEDENYGWVEETDLNAFKKVQHGLRMKRTPRTHPYSIQQHQYPPSLNLAIPPPSPSPSASSSHAASTSFTETSPPAVPRVAAAHPFRTSPHGRDEHVASVVIAAAAARSGAKQVPDGTFSDGSGYAAHGEFVPTERAFQTHANTDSARSQNRDQHHKPQSQQKQAANAAWTLMPPIKHATSSRGMVAETATELDNGMDSAMPQPLRMDAYCHFMVGAADVHADEQGGVGTAEMYEPIPLRDLNLARPSRSPGSDTQTTVHEQDEVQQESLSHLHAANGLQQRHHEQRWVGAPSSLYLYNDDGGSDDGDDDDETLFDFERLWLSHDLQARQQRSQRMIRMQDDADGTVGAAPSLHNGFPQSFDAQRGLDDGLMGDEKLLIPPFELESDMVLKQEQSRNQNNGHGHGDGHGEVQERAKVKEEMNNNAQFSNTDNAHGQESMDMDLDIGAVAFKQEDIMHEDGDCAIAEVDADASEESHV